jgi:hypothetical protein
MCVPVFFVGKCFVNTIVKVLVVGEDDMPADIVELDNSSVMHVFSSVGPEYQAKNVQSLQVLYR